MKSFLFALKEVSSLPIDVSQLYHVKSAADWQKVVVRGLLGFIWGLGGGLVAWLLSGERTVGAIIGTVIVFFLRHHLCRADEKRAFPELSQLMLASIKDREMGATYGNLLNLALFLLRPFCIFVLLLHGCWLWLPLAAMLGYSAFLDCGSMAKLNQRHWIPSAVAVLVFGGIISKALPLYHGLFMFGLISLVFCWLLPSLMQRLNLRLSSNATLYICETTALLLGVAGVAM